MCGLCSFAADHPKSDEYFSDPRLAAYAVPYCQAVSRYPITCLTCFTVIKYICKDIQIKLIAYTTFLTCNSGTASEDYLQKEIEILRTKPHWKKAYFYLWDEVCILEIRRNEIELTMSRMQKMIKENGTSCQS